MVFERVFKAFLLIIIHTPRLPLVAIIHSFAYQLKIRQVGMQIKVLLNFNTLNLIDLKFTIKINPKLKD